MELIDRYLQAVRFWLPKEQRDDITRELSEDLLAEIDDHQSTLGRALTSAEIEAMLKRRGRPFVVANQYLPQRHLIGPLLFPMWALVLKLIGLFYVLPWVIVWIAMFTFAPAFRHHVGRDLMSFWLMVTQIFAVVTIVFAIQERSFGARFGKWQPSRLPPLRMPNDRVSRANLVMEIVINAIFAAWWVGRFPLVWSPGWSSSGTLFLEFHQTFFEAVLGLALLAIANAVAALIRPDWTPLQFLVRAFSNAAMAAIAGWTVFTHAERVREALVGIPPAGALIDAGVLIALTIVTIAATITCIREIVRAQRAIIWANRAASSGSN